MRGWLDKLYTFPASYQKLEWNCQGEVLDLWQHILQAPAFGYSRQTADSCARLSCHDHHTNPNCPGNRRKRPPTHRRARRSIPTAVRSTAIAWFTEDFTTPESHAAAYKAFGNGVHAGLISAIVERWLLSADQSYTSPL